MIHDKCSGPCVKLSSMGFALRTTSPLAVEAGVLILVGSSGDKKKTDNCCVVFILLVLSGHREH